MKATKFIKGNLRRAGAFLLLLCLLLPVLCACDGDPNKTPVNTEPPTSGTTLNGVAIEQYEIRYAWRDANKEKDAAKQIQKAIKTAFGVELKVLEDSEEMSEEYVIMVGDRDQGTVTSKTMEMSDTDYALTREGDSIYLLAKTFYGMQEAADQFCEHITSATESKTVNIAKGAVQSYAGRIVNTMTFNIRCWSISDAHLARIISTVKNANYPDTIGFQEMGKSGSWVWIDKIMAIPDISSRYAYVGEDRGDGTGERAAIFYRKDKYRLIESDTKWMYGDGEFGSDKPGRVSTPHTTEHQDYYRVYSYALLERISDGVRLAHINTHLDTVSYYENSTIGLQVQTQQLSYAIAMAKKLHKENNCTVVFTGDFNTKSSSSSFKSITAAGFEWTEQITKKKVGMQVNDTYHGEKEPLTICKDIDHIFIMDDNPYCICYTICDKKIAYKGVEDYASDHLARYATYVVD